MFVRRFKQSVIDEKKFISLTFFNDEYLVDLKKSSNFVFRKGNDSHPRPAVSG